jgi:hypothetical protein
MTRKMTSELSYRLTLKKLTWIFVCFPDVLWEHGLKGLHDSTSMDILPQRACEESKADASDEGPHCGSPFV